ncbi:septum site-determining protein MinC [Kurthia zopfii]|uniref:septum site-determining protein MinC n=1 Tax=Kurthia zopfii TaxID=1650 RepID=UPI002F91EC2C
MEFLTTKQLVYLKGAKEGLILHLDDQCGYDELIHAIQNRFMEGHIDEQVEIQISTGNRYCTNAQMTEILNEVEKALKVRVSKVRSDVVTIEELNQRLSESQSSTYIGIVRSGQMVEATGDLIVIGDVNPNARVQAGGSIYVLGKLKGMAHAGKDGDSNAVIGASFLSATHLSIGEVRETMTNERKELSEMPEMSCAYLNDEGDISVKRLQEIRIIRPELATFKGGS